MGLLDGGLAAVFGAAFGAVMADAVLRKVRQTETGTGGSAVTVTDYPAKASLDAIGAGERAASGIPASAIRITVLRAGLPVGIDLDDEVMVGGATYRTIRVDGDPAGATFVLMVVPA